MKTSYFTFGSDHQHTYHGEAIDPNINTIKITADDPRAIMHALFGDKWAFEYPEDMAEECVFKYYPRFGVKEVTV